MAFGTLLIKLFGICLDLCMSDVVQVEIMFDTCILNRWLHRCGLAISATLNTCWMLLSAHAGQRFASRPECYSFWFDCAVRSVRFGARSIFISYANWISVWMALGKFRVGQWPFFTYDCSCLKMLGLGKSVKYVDLFLMPIFVFP